MTEDNVCTGNWFQSVISESQNKMFSICWHLNPIKFPPLDRKSSVKFNRTLGKMSMERNKQKSAPDKTFKLGL